MLLLSGRSVVIHPAAS